MRRKQRDPGRKLETDYNERNILRDDNPKTDFEVMRERFKQEKLSAKEKDQLFIRKKDLEERIAHGMPTHAEMWRPTEDNVEKHRAWEKANAQYIDELKRISRRLDPDNPNAGRIEHLRKQGEADKLAKWS